MQEIEIKKIGIVVIQSLGEEDQKTGEEVYKVFIKDKVVEDADFFSDFHDVDNKTDFLDYLKYLDDTYEEGTLYTLHFETHGSEAGISLSSGEVVTWQEFHDAIRPINIKMNNLLVVVMAMCFGGALTSYLDPYNRAPFLCFVGSTREESEHAISRGFKEFYAIYTSPLDIAKALPALWGETEDDNGNSHFWCKKSSELYDEIMNPDRDPVALSQMASDIFVKEKMKGRKCTKSEIEKEMREKMKADAIAYRDYFTFADIYNDVPKK